MYVTDIDNYDAAQSKQDRRGIGCAIIFWTVELGLVLTCSIHYGREYGLWAGLVVPVGFVAILVASVGGILWWAHRQARPMTQEDLESVIGEVDTVKDWPLEQVRDYVRRQFETNPHLIVVPVRANEPPLPPDLASGIREFLEEFRLVRDGIDELVSRDAVRRQEGAAWYPLSNSDDGIRVLVQPYDDSVYQLRVDCEDQLPYHVAETIWHYLALRMYSPDGPATKDGP